MANYKLTYFDITGKATPARYMFSLAGIAFEDVRVQREDWPAMKDTMPLKVLPVLDVEGHARMTQSPSIDRFVAKRCNMLGDNEVDAAIVDQVYTTVLEASEQLGPLFQGETSTDPEKKEAYRVKMIAELLPRFFTFIEGKLRENGGGDGYIVGSKPTLADVTWASLAGFVKLFDPDGILVAAHPKLFALSDRLMASPQIQAFEAKLTKSPTADS